VNDATAFLVIMAMSFGLMLPRMLFECFSPRPHEPGTNVLAIATPSKNGSARSCIQYCGDGAADFGTSRVNR
jgi:hypothetical protein